MTPTLFNIDGNVPLLQEETKVQLALGCGECAGRCAKGSGFNTVGIVAEKTRRVMVRHCGRSRQPDNKTSTEAGTLDASHHTT